MNIVKANRLMKDVFHRDGYTGKDCVIAVIDTAAADIPQLNGKLTFCDEYRCDDLNKEDHGTFVLSQISAWAPDAELLSYCVFPNGQGNTKRINAALEDVIARAKANPEKQYFINMSLASNFGRNVMTPTYARMHELIKECNANRIQVCVASGNDGGEQLYIYPSRFEEPVCVAAAFGNGSQAWFSVSHDTVDFLDFGVEVQGYDRNGHTAWMSGTSMACPNLVGKSVLLACKMRSDNGVWPSEMELYNELKECAIDCESVGYDIKSGYGFVDIRNCDGTYASADKIDGAEKTIEVLRVAKQFFKSLLGKVGSLVKTDIPQTQRASTVKIGHAVMDENGSITGPISGDQTGKEVQIATWYAKNSKGVGWSHYIELKDAVKREQFAQFIEAAAANPNIGYSQDHRTALYDSMKNGNSVDSASGDVDCTSLIFIGLKLICGISVAIGYSGNMATLLKATGQFNIYTDASHLTTDKLAKRGGIYLRKGHALTVLENGPDTDYASEADQIDPPYVLVLGRVNVRPTAGTEHKPIYTASKGEKLPFGEIDDDTGWYAVETPRGLGFITNKPRYTKLVEE